MESNHRTHLLFIEPKNPPTEIPIEDELSVKVDFIFSQLVVGEGMYRGWHDTPFGEMSDYYDYIHPVFPLVSNSLAGYYIRHHRADISPKQLAWIEELYDILKDPDAYYRVDLKPASPSWFARLTNDSKPIYYFKLYEKSGGGYEDACSYGVKAMGTEGGIQNLLRGTFFRILSKKEFEEEIKHCESYFEQITEGCSVVEVYDVLKDDLRKQYDNQRGIGKSINRDIDPDYGDENPENKGINSDGILNIDTDDSE